jgi:hypothetical protein
MKDRGRGGENSSMEKMFEAFREGINLGKESGGEDGSPMERMIESMAPAVAASLLGGGATAQEVIETPRAAIEAPRAPQKPRQAPKPAPQPTPGDVGNIISQLRTNPKLAAAAYNKIKAEHGKPVADKLAKEYNIPIPANAVKQRTLKVV